MGTCGRAAGGEGGRAEGTGGQLPCPLPPPMLTSSNDTAQTCKTGILPGADPGFGFYTQNITGQRLMTAAKPTEYTVR